MHTMWAEYHLPLELQLSLFAQPRHQHGGNERAKLAAGVEVVDHVLEATRD